MERLKICLKKVLIKNYYFYIQIIMGSSIKKKPLDFRIMRMDLEDNQHNVPCRVYCIDGQPTFSIITNSNTVI